jgi:L-lactate dehydrogenase complex protein LldF
MIDVEKRKLTFLDKSEQKAHDLKHKKVINFNIDKYNAAVKNGKQQYEQLELARKMAKNTKWSAIENLEKNLNAFEKNFTLRGGKVLWAENAKQALDYILEICEEKQTTTVVKSKSMVTEEIHLNDFLAKHKIQSIETDLGEYIQQLDGEPPYHIVTPAMHKSKEDIAELFHNKLGVAPNLTPSELTLIAREKLRNKYKEAQVGITGANFIVADVGGICITENEGNGRLTTTLPKTHIAIVGIEKVIPSMQNLALFWPLLSTFGTGQKVTVYNTLLTGPRQKGENDGPEEMYVILLDNGRTNLLQPDVRQSMYCIRCGSCLNACPVYKNIGGHTYDTIYSGPIGSVITPHLKGMQEYGHLSFASSLCGNCTEVCPMNIQLHEMLLINRQQYNHKGYGSLTEKIMWKIFKSASQHRFMFDMATPKMKNVGFKKFFSPLWGGRRESIEFPKKTFHQLWKEEQKGKK